MPRPKACPNRHQYSSAWENDPTSKVIELPIRKGLLVRLVYQYRYFYPPGGSAPACCTHRRRVPQIVGYIESRSDTERVAASLNALAVNVGRAAL